MKPIIKCLLALLLAANLTTAAHAAQNRFTDPKQTLDDEFWGRLYKDGGETFFCNKPFTKKSILVTEAYIYSASWMREHLRCGTPRQCRDNDANYRRMASDLHNIFPADTRIELERRNARFEELPAEIDATECGLKRSFQIIEPPDAYKGDIARILFYMVESYNLPLIGDINQLKRWSQIDPPSQEELERNQRILQIQGNGNRFVSDPAAAESFNP